MYMVLLGAPGAGKDTLADQIRQKIGATILTTGALYRREAELGTALGLKAKNYYWGRGLLCPDEMTNKITRNAFKRTNGTKKNLIFNGYPRSLDQAKYLENEICRINLVLDLCVSEDVAVKRLLARRREDDTEEVIRERFRVYHENNTKLVEYLKDLEFGKYAALNADQNIPRVYKDALKVLGE